MPAPSPIQIRYGNSGLLGQAVALAAQNQARQRQGDQDMQFLMNTLQHHNAMQEMVTNNAFEAQKLQLAHAYNNAQAAPPADNYVNKGFDPTSDAMLKNTYFNSAAADLPSDQATNLKALISNRNVSPDEFRSVIFDATKKAQTRSDEDADAKSKAEYVKSATAGMSPADAAALNSMVGDKKTTLAQIRTAADAIRSRQTVLPRTQLVVEAAGIDNQARTLKQQMDSVRRAINKATGGQIDPEATPPEALNPAYRDPSQGVAGFGSRLNDRLNPFSSSTGLVSGGVDPAIMQQYIAYQKMKQKLAALLTQRQQLMGKYQTPAAFNAMTPAGQAEMTPAGNPAAGISISPSHGFPAPAAGGVINVNGATAPANGPKPVSAMSDEELLQALQQ
jgi:hypothetical protein